MNTVFNYLDIRFICIIFLKIKIMKIKNALFVFNYDARFFQNSAVDILGQVLLLLIWRIE